MALYHGTSAATAFKILTGEVVKPSRDGFFYCFNSVHTESLAGALCFATGDGPRNGSIKEKNLFAKYAALNPDFPRGPKGLFYKFALKKIGAVWVNSQMAQATDDLDHKPAILVFEDNAQTRERTRQGFVREVQVPGAALRALVLSQVYMDDSAVSAQYTVPVTPISQCVGQVLRDLRALKA